MIRFKGINGLSPPFQWLRVCWQSMAYISKTLKKNDHLADILNHVPVESKALGDQVYTAIDHLVEIRSII